MTLERLPATLLASVNPLAGCESPKVASGRPKPVDYEVPLGILGDLARSLFVTRTVERIFDFRARTMEELLGAQEPRPDASGVFAQNMRSEIAKPV